MQSMTELAATRTDSLHSSLAAITASLALPQAIRALILSPLGDQNEQAWSQSLLTTARACCRSDAKRRNF
jgi:hypothetical protein